MKTWHSGAESVWVNGQKIHKLANVTVHPALRQRLHADNQYLKENHSITEWLTARCHTEWPKKSDIPLHTGMSSFMKDCMETTESWPEPLIDHLR